ncbi:16403_t:CDS:2, partial [Dentiscutata erythropus]
FFMNIAQYKEQIRQYNFVHSTNQRVLCSKYKAKPDPSCSNCNPANLNFALAAQFSRFWPWFQFKYQAQTKWTAISGFITTPIQSENNSNSETSSTTAIIVESTCSSSNSSTTALVAESTHLTNNTTHNPPTETITNTIATTTYNPANIASTSNNINTNTNSNPYGKFFINIFSDLSNMSGQRTSTRITHQIPTLIDIQDRNNENNRHRADERHVPINNEQNNHLQHEREEFNAENAIRAIIKGLRQLSQNHTERATADTNPKEYKLVDFSIFSGSHDDNPVEWYETFNRAYISNNISEN